MPRNPGLFIDSKLTMDRRSRTQRLVFSLGTCTVQAKSSILMLSSGRTIRGLAADGRRLSFTNFTSAAFTQAGTFASVCERLDYLSDIGVTAVELMPVADFPGRRNWGYDGVYPFAPDSCYGRPEDLKKLVQTAHGRGMMVFLDVVYNHFGPEGNYLGLYAPQFFTDRHHTPWGNAINFDGSESQIGSGFLHSQRIVLVDRVPFRWSAIGRGERNP